MKKFKFRLQRVLDTKEDFERQRQRELGEAQQGLMIAEEKLDTLNREAEEQDERQRILISGRAKVAELMVNNRWRVELRKRIALQSKEVKRCERLVEERRLILLEATKERKVLEKLKEKQREQHRKEYFGEQQRILDEIGSRQVNGSERRVSPER